MTTTDIENAFAVVEELTLIIRQNCSDFDGNTAIDVLRNLIASTSWDDADCEARGTASAASDARLSLRAATASLLNDIERNRGALTYGLTAGEAGRAVDECRSGERGSTKL
jgi:hypothetical protein